MPVQCLFDAGLRVLMLFDTGERICFFMIKSYFTKQPLCHPVEYDCITASFWGWSFSPQSITHKGDTNFQISKQFFSEYIYIYIYIYICVYIYIVAGTLALEMYTLKLMFLTWVCRFVNLCMEVGQRQEGFFLVFDKIVDNGSVFVARWFLKVWNWGRFVSS